MTKLFGSIAAICLSLAVSGCVLPKDHPRMVAFTERAARAEALVTPANKEQCESELRKVGNPTRLLELKADPEMTNKALFVSDRKGAHGGSLVMFNTVYEHTGLLGKSQVEAGCLFEINGDSLTLESAHPDLESVRGYRVDAEYMTRLRAN